MSKNNNLHAAKTAKNDEFYTRFEDINDEINREEHGYVKHFKDSVVYCNCDDPEESNFWKFFKIRFRFFQMKKLIATHYSADKGASYKLEYDGKSVVKTELKGNGDFRSEECVELLKESDIVVTNPPFSLFREFVAQLMKYEKKFIIWGNNNAITYKEIFPLIKDNKIWLGYTCNDTLSFRVPVDYRYDEKETNRINDGYHYGKVPAISVFTNLDIPKRHVPINSKWKFETGIKMGIYQKYDNYDAWNVDKVAQIPGDYDGVLGVPITFLDRFCPEEFEIIGLAPERNKQDESVLQTKRYKNAIQYNKDGSTNKGSKVNDGPVIVHDDFFGKYPYYKSETLPDKYLEVLYARILVKRK